jgi:hypothetical protein
MQSKGASIHRSITDEPGTANFLRACRNSSGTLLAAYIQVHRNPLIVAHVVESILSEETQFDGFNFADLLPNGGGATDRLIQEFPHCGRLIRELRRTELHWKMRRLKPSAGHVISHQHSHVASFLSSLEIDRLPEPTTRREWLLSGVVLIVMNYRFWRAP